MLVKHYSLFDAVAKEHVRVITSQNDETAVRALAYIVRDSKFDKIQGKDLVLVHLYDLDTSTGLVSNNDVRTLVAVASEMAKAESERILEAVVKSENKEVETDGESKESEGIKES